MINTKLTTLTLDGDDLWGIFHGDKDHLTSIGKREFHLRGDEPLERYQDSAVYLLGHGFGNFARVSEANAHTHFATVYRHACVDYDRHKHAQRRYSMSDCELPPNDFLNGRNGFDPCRIAARNELVIRVRRSVMDLPRLEREAILLRFEEDLDYRTIGERIGVTEAAARARCSRGRNKLERVLTSHG